MNWKGIVKIKKEQAVVVFLIGVLLMVITLPARESGKKENSGQQSETSRYSEQEADSSGEDFASELEAKLEDCLSQMDGVGKVRVLITMKTSSEQVVAKDRTASESVQKAEEGDQETDNSEETVYQEQDGDKTPYIVKEIAPVVKGVLVIAQGGDDPVVKQNISEAVMALFSIESHKINVVRMKEG